MKPFDSKGACPKCKCKTVRTIYCNDPPVGDICYRQDVKREHLHRTCSRCHYEWLEAVAQA